MSKYTLRIRFRLSKVGSINLNENFGKYQFIDSKKMKLMYEQETNTEENRWMALISDGWSSKRKAEKFSERIVDALRMSLARFDLSANFGRRAFKSTVFQSGLDMLKNYSSKPILNNVHGKMIFPSDLKPSFATMGTLTPVRVISAEQWERIFQPALESDYLLSEREKTAFDLYAAAHNVRKTPDAAFALLFTAFETLLGKKERPESVKNHVDNLIKQTSDSELPEDEIASLVGTLKWLKSYSIRQSGHSLVNEKLADQKYEEKTAAEVFEECYDLRNRLIHGKIPFPGFKEVSSLVSTFQLMIGHLLAGPILKLDIK